MIDDEAALRKLVGRMLERAGFEVLLAEDGREGIRHFEENRDRIDAVVLDMIMPDLGGDRVFEALRARRGDLPVLVSSGYAADGKIEDLLSRDGVYFLEKPFQRARLVELLERALGGS